MNTLRKCIALAAATAAASAVQADIELGNGLSVAGFVDMSAVYQDPDDGPTTSVFNVDQVETNFFYSDGGDVTARVDIEYTGGNGGQSVLDASGNAIGTVNDSDDLIVEQAFITKQLNDQFSVTGGRFLSYTGWETEEPTGLYQYSGVGYGGVFYGGYQQGISGMYTASDAVAVTLNIVNDLYDGNETNSRSSLGTELGLHLTPAEGVTAKAFYLAEGENTSINLWASYATGDLTLAFEYNTREDDDTAEGYEADGYLLMANYAIGDYGVTFRYGAWEQEDDDQGTYDESSNFTIAGSKACSDNLLLVAEYRMDTQDVGDIDSDTVALEALYTF